MADVLVELHGLLLFSEEWIPVPVTICNPPSHDRIVPRLSRLGQLAG